MTTAGFIGLGSQGAGMAQRMIEVGLPTILWARDTAALEPFRGRAEFASDPAELGRKSQVVGICVTDGTAVREVALGPTGVLAGMAAGGIVAIHSTIGTDECAEIAVAAARRGVDVIDAPVSGGGAAAAVGALTVYVGGAEATVERARPVLETYGNPVLHMGALGSGLQTKLINNVLNAAHFALAHDAMAVGEAWGLDSRDLAGALRRAGAAGASRSRSSSACGSFDPIADHVGPLLSKDVELFSREARSSVVDEDRALLTCGRPLPRTPRLSATLGRQPEGVISMTRNGRARPSVDVRTRNRGGGDPVDPAVFWEQDWITALARHGEQAAADAERLGVMPLTIGVDQRAWTLRIRAGRIEATGGREEPLVVHLDQVAFTDWIHERKTAMGLAIGGRVDGDGSSNQMFCAWDPVVRAVVDGRALYRPGDVTLEAPDGTVLDVNQEFRLGEQPREAAHFLAEAGFILLKDVFTEDEMAAIDADLGRAVEAAQPDDGESWWAGTTGGERYPCRILDFTAKSDHLRELDGRSALSRLRTDPR